MIAPISNQPACVRCKDKRLFCEALRKSSSAVLKMTFPLVCGTPNGERRTPPRTAARAAQYPAIPSGDVRADSMPSKHLKHQKNMSFSRSSREIFLSLVDRPVDERSALTWNGYANAAQTPSSG